MERRRIMKEKRDKKIDLRISHSEKLRIQ